MLELDDVSVTFRVGRKDLHAVRHATLTIADGEVFGIVGTSGAGKSTLLRTINLLQKPVSGAIFVDGVDISKYKGRDLRALRSSIGIWRVMATMAARAATTSAERQESKFPRRRAALNQKIPSSTSPRR